MAPSAFMAGCRLRCVATRNTRYPHRTKVSYRAALVAVRRVRPGQRTCSEREGMVTEWQTWS